MEYEYDDNNRLLRENKFTGSNNNFCNTTRYNYDNNGNMLYKASGNVTANTTQMGEFAITTSTGYKYERNVYDSFNRLTSTYNTYTGKSASYTYYPNDLRQSKTVDNTTTEFFWDGDNIALETDSSHNLKNIYTYGVNRIMSENASDTKQYYMYDPHGDVQGLVNASGTLTKTYEYDAFGNEINKSATDTNPFRYCGEYYDTETDNIYLRHRYYSPSLGRFTTEDPIRDGGNWYGYVEGNPMKFTDMLGLAKRYIFYTDDTSNETDLVTPVQQAIIIAGKIGINYPNDTVEIIHVTSSKDFVDKYNALPEEDVVFLEVICHGIVEYENKSRIDYGVGSLSFEDGSQFYSDDDTIYGEECYNMSDIYSKNITEIYFSACNSANPDLKTNIAQAFYDKNPETQKVSGWDGGVAFVKCFPFGDYDYEDKKTKSSHNPTFDHFANENKTGIFKRIRKGLVVIE